MAGDLYCYNCLVPGVCQCNITRGGHLYADTNHPDATFYGPGGVVMPSYAAARTAHKTAKAPKASTAASASADPAADLLALCVHCVRGTCHFGVRCRFSHDPVRVAKTQTTIRGIRANLASRGIALDTCRYRLGCRDAGCTYHDV
jgi:Zinc finger C-x8-C-x5-C-x3-H type (and similar)